MKKVLFIVGPTAVGKTALAFEISQKTQSVLISADSAQVFRGTDIITGKDLPVGRQACLKNSKFDHYIIDSTPLYLVDVADPSESFSVSNFIQDVQPVVRNATADNKLPIIVGGTRFYIHALTHNIDTLFVPPNEKLREKLGKLSVERLQKKLKKLNPEKLKSLNNSDKNNPRRLIRAIEVSMIPNDKNYIPLFNKDEVLMIGLKDSFENIKKKIDTRLAKRLEDGAIGEAEKMFENYNNLSDQVKAINGFNQLFEYFRGEASLEEAIDKWRISEYQLAKSQLKWLEKDQNIVVFDVAKRGFKDEILKLIRSV